MCDLQWDPLAELYLTRVDWVNEIYCLCSRVFTRSKEDNYNKLTIDPDLTASENEDRDDDVIQLLDEPIDHSQHTNSDIKHDFDPEVVSCYCSASHTDNISTDEHDSLRDSHSIRPILHKGIQSSDSGADLTEHLKSDPDASWQKYWAKHGERLIWDSWIEKYSDYINPEYLVNCDSETNNEQAVSESKENDNFNFKAEHSKTRFSFDKKDIDKVETNLSIIDENKVLTENGEYKVQEVACKNRMLVRNLSGSDSYDKLNTDISEGWNPLSPLSIDCETEAERLLSSRCGSYASGSVRTVDSMTNVTRMTVSSIDLSESSKNSDSFSSVSSVQSSLSSSSDDFDENADFDVQWNILWKKHYEEEYLEQYKNYLLQTGKLDEDNPELKKEDNLLSHKTVIQSMKILGIERKNSNTSSIDDSESNSKKSKHKRITRKSIESVGHLLNNLRMEESERDEHDKSDALKKSNEKSTSLEDDSMQYEDLDDGNLNSLGLPISFGKKKHKQDSLPKSFSLNNLDTDASDQSASNRIKAAFNLMGIELNEGGESKFRGQVDYKMKHIRLQNRQLKLNYNQNKFVHKPKHTYFDDDGEEIADDRESDEVVQPDNITDNSENKLSSSSNDEEENENKEVEEKSDVMPLSRKRKRKRKLALPPEIKENPKLKKYWHRRFSLFNKFDMGIKLDEESWYSVTPEQVAKHTAQRCQCDVIVDAFCGAGGNSIQFAFTCERVIAVDIDPKKIELARNNAEVYGVADRIEFIVGDFFKLAETLKADAVFLSPPWGGPQYLNLATYELEDMLEPAPLSDLLSSARKISENLALFLPKNSNTYALLKAAGSGGFVEIEQNFINKKLIAITAYYNDLIKQI